MNPFQVLLRPVVSEKASELRESAKKYTFLIHRKATKLDVKAAVEKAFEVNVVGVQTSIQRGKLKRRGMNIGRAATRKKAVVSLSKGQSLKIFDEQ